MLELRCTDCGMLLAHMTKIVFDQEGDHRVAILNSRDAFLPDGTQPKPFAKIECPAGHRAGYTVTAHE